VVIGEGFHDGFNIEPDGRSGSHHGYLAVSDHPFDRGHGDAENASKLRPSEKASVLGRSHGLASVEIVPFDGSNLRGKSSNSPEEN